MDGSVTKYSRFSKGTKAGILGSILGVLLSFGLLFVPLIGGIAGGMDYPVRPGPATPAPPLQPARLMIGIGVAVVLAAIAGWLIRHTDWDTPVQ